MTRLHMLDPPDFHRTHENGAYVGPKCEDLMKMTFKNIHMYPKCSGLIKKTETSKCGPMRGGLAKPFPYMWGNTIILFILWP